MSLGLLVTEDTSLGYLLSRNMSLGCSVTKDMSLGFLVAGDTPLGLSVIGDVSLGHCRTGDVSLGIPETGDMSLGCLVTRDVSLGHTEAGDLQVQGTCWVSQQRVGLQGPHLDGDTRLTLSLAGARHGVVSGVSLVTSLHQRLVKCCPDVVLES